MTQARKRPTNRNAKPMAHRVRNSSVSLENAQNKIPLYIRNLSRFLIRARRQLGLRHEAVFVRFVSDVEMKRLNRAYRKKPKTTDVLSFPSEHRSRPRSLSARAKALRGAFLGDIAISPTVACQNAKRFGRSLEQEICILILHGFLHLLGYDHETDRGEMERLELKLRRKLGLA